MAKFPINLFVSVLIWGDFVTTIKTATLPTTPITLIMLYATLHLHMEKEEEKRKRKREKEGIRFVEAIPVKYHVEQIKLSTYIRITVVVIP